MAVAAAVGSVWLVGTAGCGGMGCFFCALVVTKPSLAQDFDEFTHRYSFFKLDASPNDKARNLHARACTCYTKFPTQDI